MLSFGIRRSRYHFSFRLRYKKIIDNEIDIITFIHPDDKDLVFNTYNQVLSYGGKYDINYKILDSSGSFLEVRDIGSRTLCKMNGYCLGGSIRFVPSPEVAYISKVSNIIHTASKQGDLGVYYFRLSDKKIFWTTQLLNIFGVDTEPSVEEYWNFLLDEYRSNSFDRFEKMLFKPQDLKSVYKIKRKNDGAIRTLFTKSSPIFNESNDLIAVSGTTIDITDLLKILNFESEEIFKSINDRLASKEDSVIFFKYNNNFISVSFIDIIAISALRDYVQVYVKGKKSPYIIYKTLKEMHEKLPKSQFIQIHRSHIINLREIIKVSYGLVEIADLSLPVSRTYWTALKIKMGI